VASALTAYKKELSNHGSEGFSLHVWITCTHPDYQGKGLMKNLIALIKSIALQKGFKFLTLNTSEQKFSAMYHIMAKQKEKKELDTKPDGFTTFIVQLI